MGAWIRLLASHHSPLCLQGDRGQIHLLFHNIFGDINQASYLGAAVLLYCCAARVRGSSCRPARVGAAAGWQACRTWWASCAEPACVPWLAVDLSALRDLRRAMNTT